MMSIIIAAIISQKTHHGRGFTMNSLRCATQPKVKLIDKMGVEPPIP